MSNIPTIRWGLIGTGWISTAFSKDLVAERSDPKANHIIQAIGCSSLEKGEAFVQNVHPTLKPTVYGSYAECYNDPNVDVIYIGTPHALHKQACLDAIAAGKHVLCEKAFTLNTREAKEVFAAAKAKGVFIMEAMWTRFFPLTRKLQHLIHEKKILGDVTRIFADFSLDMNIQALGPESRYKKVELGAGSLLDIGIYSLTWGLLCLDSNIGEEAETPKIVSALSRSLEDGVELTSSILLLYPETGRQGILTSAFSAQTDVKFARIEGTKGKIVVEGNCPRPRRFTFIPKGEGAREQVFDFSDQTGFIYEADAVALDIAAGRTENSIMPWAETVRVMEIMDEIRYSNGALFPQDKL